jgi:flagellar hook protein FlgE
MSIWGSLFTGSSGLDAFGQAIGVVGDNIANVSTVGFKSSRASFEDVLGGSAPNGQRLGNGVRMGGPETSFMQGGLQQTGRALDLAVRGNGMFTLRGAHDGIEGQYYTRDGRFGFDESGYIVNSEGLRLQGYQVDPVTGQLSPAATDIQIDSQLAPRATTEADMALNLDASSEILATPWDPTNPETTSNYSTSMTVYDSLGNAHRMDMYFRNNGGGAWEWHAMVDGSELTGGLPGPVEIGSGSLQFNTDGALDSDTINFSSADFIDATPGQILNIDFGDAITDGGTGLSGTTMYGAASAVTSTSQDGYASGVLADLSMADDGTMRARYSNGQTRDAARVALAGFSNLNGLRREGSALFSETLESGAALVSAAATGGRGSISGGALEGSNVDLGSELVTLIAYQRAFQANARTVTTADEMLAETANLKR